MQKKRKITSFAINKYVDRNEKKNSVGAAEYTN